MLSTLLCTAFLLESGEALVVGKSYDWDVGDGRVIVNKRGVGKQSLPLEPSQIPLKWRAKYGSVTFNQYGRELPNGGMNEAGLMVEVLWLNASRFPAPDTRPTINELQFIQYLLDNFSTVDELAKEVPKIRVSPVYAKVHYFTCDKQKHCAAIEYLDGKLLLTPSTVPVLTNNTYEESLQKLKKSAAPGPAGSESMNRFLRTAHALNQKGSPAVIERAWTLLDGVSQGDFSKWNIVYDPVARQVHYRTHKYKRKKRIAFSDLDFACGAPVRVVDIDAGDKVGFSDYRTDDNRALIAATVKKLDHKFPPELLEQLARFPEQLPCLP